MPADLVGDGVAALLRLSLELASRSQGTVLMEEPELHLHPAAIHRSAQAMATACERGVQIVLTTHSLELVDALLEVRRKTSLAELAVARTRLTEGELRTHLIAGEELDLIRHQIESDLR